MRQGGRISDDNDNNNNNNNDNNNDNNSDNDNDDNDECPSITYLHSDFIRITLFICGGHQPSKIPS